MSMSDKQGHLNVIPCDQGGFYSCEAPNRAVQGPGMGGRATARPTGMTQRAMWSRWSSEYAPGPVAASASAAIARTRLYS
jgi:hypothetical protein